MNRRKKRERLGLMVMALDCRAGGREFKLRRFQNIFDLTEQFDGGDEKRFDEWFDGCNLHSRFKSHFALRAS